MGSIPSGYCVRNFSNYEHTFFPFCNYLFSLSASILLIKDMLYLDPIVLSQFFFFFNFPPFSEWSLYKSKTFSPSRVLILILLALIRVVYIYP